MGFRPRPLRTGFLYAVAAAAGGFLAFGIPRGGCSGGPELGQESGRIRGGDPSTDQRVAALYSTLPSPAPPGMLNTICSATLVCPNLLLTIDHCEKANLQNVSFRQTLLQDPAHATFSGAGVSVFGPDAKVTKWFVDPHRYPMPIGGDDTLAMAKIEWLNGGPPPGVSPAGIQQQSTWQTGALGEVVGYGMTNDTASMLGIRRQATLSYYQTEGAFVEMMPFGATVSAAGEIQNAVGPMPCPGDSGGPMFTANLVAGVSDFIFPVTDTHICDVAEYAGIFDVTRESAWISSIMSQECGACGEPSQPCCGETICGSYETVYGAHPGLCQGGFCESCGHLNQQCCANSECDDGFTCPHASPAPSGGTTCIACGGQDQHCCPDPHCPPGTYCAPHCLSGFTCKGADSNAMCAACGHLGQQCCDNAQCLDPTTACGDKDPAVGARTCQKCGVLDGPCCPPNDKCNDKSLICLVGIGKHCRKK